MQLRSKLITFMVYIYLGSGANLPAKFVNFHYKLILYHVIVTEHKHIKFILYYV